MASAKRAKRAGGSDRSSVERGRSAAALVTRAHRGMTDAFKALARTRGCHDAAACRAVWVEATSLFAEAQKHLATARRLQTTEG